MKNKNIKNQTSSVSKAELRYSKSGMQIQMPATYSEMSLMPEQRLKESHAEAAMKADSSIV